ncbi:MAG: hypothetical protein P8M34_00125 [Saprospiraceae bacterium]|nr:hypothetical protein [Saprospiraceae bacterium]|tara:strand:- start:795 stop:1262 length:468 start_codon:yes stop_codon:yes gene_type:complete
MKLFIILITTILIMSCEFNSEHKHDKAHNHDHKHVEDHDHDHDNDEDGHQELDKIPIDIIGKTIEYKYGESIYHVTVDSETDLHWEAMEGGETGAIGVEKYVMDYLPNGEVFISWEEETGIGVSQILDFKNGKVYNHLLKERVASTGPGEIRILE